MSGSVGRIDRCRGWEAFARRVVTWAAGAAAAGSLMATPTAALEIISIPIDQVTTGAAGDVVLVATLDVPDEFVGKTCSLIGTTDNQESVHEGNDLLITTGSHTIVIPNFEDEGFIVHQDGEVEAIAESIEVSVRLGPDGVSSGGFRVDLDCPEEPSTTTTVPPTTAPSATPPPTSALVPPSAAPSTTAPSTTAPTSTAPSTTAPSTSAPPPLPPGDDQPGLPVTGSSSALVVLVGIFVACAGVALADWSRVATIRQR